MVSNGPTIFISHVGDSQFSVAIRSHELTVDQPHAAGGDDSGPTPTELFVSSLAACVAFYGRSFLHRRGLPDAISVSAHWSMDLHPSRVTHIGLTVDAPGVPLDRRDAFRRAIEHCTVHNSLTERPQISFEVVSGPDSRVAAS